MSIGNEKSGYELTCSIRAAPGATRRVESMVAGEAPRAVGNKRGIVFYKIRIGVLYHTVVYHQA